MDVTAAFQNKSAVTVTLCHQRVVSLCCRPNMPSQIQTSPESAVHLQGVARRLQSEPLGKLIISFSGRFTAREPYREFR